MDRSSEWANAVDRSCAAMQLPQAEVARIKGALLMRPIRKPSEFSKFATVVAKSIEELSNMIQTQHKSYLSTSLYTEKEKNALEAEVSLFVKTCGSQIERLKQSVLSGAERKDERGRPVMPPQAVAHLHGVVLVLAESLQATAARFDALRIQRQRQKALVEQRRKAPGVPWGAQGQHAVITGMPSASLSTPGSGGQFTGSQQQQQLLERENKHLVEYLTSTQQGVVGIQKSAMEIAQLNQLFSAAISSQAASIEQIYNNAVEATGYVQAGNVELGKTIAVNRSSRKYILVFLAVATICLLFFDWLNS